MSEGASPESDFTDRIDCAADFCEVLRRDGFSIDPETVVRFVELLEITEKRGQSIADMRAMTVFRPLFAKSAKEQARFEEHWKEFIRTADDSQSIVSAPSEIRSDRRRFLTIGILLVAVVVGFLLFQGEDPRPTPPRGANEAAESASSSPAATRPIESRSVATDSLPASTAVVDESPVSKPTPMSSDDSATPWYADRQFFIPTAIIAIIAVLVFRRYRAVRLARRARRAKDNVATIEIDEAAEIREESRSAARHIGRVLSKIDETVGCLDVGATVVRCARSGGFLRPVMRHRVRRFGLIVFLERRSTVDHQCHDVEDYFRRLRHCGVPVEVHTWFDSPRRLDARRGTKSADILRRSFGDELWLIGDAARLFDPFTGEISPEFAARPGVRVFDFGTTGEVARRHEKLRSAGFLVEDTDRTELLDHRMARAGSYVERLLAFSDLGELIHDDRAPEAARRELLLEILEVALDRHVRRWLCAAAIYPELHPILTRAIGRRFAKAEPSSPIHKDARAQLNALPWMRRGRIPDWLRWALLDKLSRREFDTAKDAVIEVFSHAGSAANSDRIDIATAPPSSPGRMEKSATPGEVVGPTAQHRGFAMPRSVWRRIDSAAVHDLDDTFRFWNPAKLRARVLAFRVRRILDAVVGVVRPLLRGDLAVVCLLLIIGLTTEMVERSGPSLEKPAGPLVEDPEPSTRELVLSWATPKPGTGFTSDGYPKEVIHTKTGIEMVFVPAGEFMMGSGAAELDVAKKLYALLEDPSTTFEDFVADETWHPVRITTSFYLAKYEISNAVYKKWKRDHTSNEYKKQSLDGDEQPAVYVSWDDAKKFCTENDLRLPFEAEWEYAARGRTDQKSEVFPWGNRAEDGGPFANIADKTALSQFNWTFTPLTDDGLAVTCRVTSMKPNGFGLHQMIGNVWEWCEDWYDAAYYTTVVAGSDPRGPSSSPISARVLRGGSWHGYPISCRSAYRYWLVPAFVNDDVGFRPARDP